MRRRLADAGDGPPHCRIARLVVGTYRDLEADASGPLARALADLRRERLLDRIGLAGLRQIGDGGARRRSQRRAGSDVALAERLCEQTGGNPFFIELMRSLDEAPDASARAGGRQGGDRRSSGSTAAACAGSAHPGGRAGDRFPACHPADRRERAEVDDLIASLEAARAARLVVEDPGEVDRFSFVHALVRETL